MQCRTEGTAVWQKERGREVVVTVTVSGNYSGPVTWVDGGKKGGLKLLTRSCPWPGLTAC